MTASDVRHSWYSWLWPFTFARNIFRPDTAHLKNPVQTIADVRSALGFLLIVGIALSVPANTPGDIVVDRVAGLALAYIATVATVAAAAGVYQANLYRNSTRSPELRQHYVTTVRSLRAIWLRLAVFAAVNGGWWVIDTLTGGDPTDGNPVIVLVALWVGLVTFPVHWYTVRYTFGIGEVDPRLGPMVTSVAAALAYGLDKALQPARDPMPADIQEQVKLIALGSVVLIAAYEWYRIGRVAEDEPGDDTGAERPIHERPARSYERPYSSAAMITAALCVMMPPASVLVAPFVYLKIDSSRERGRALLLVTALLGTVLMIMICAGAATGT